MGFFDHFHKNGTSAIKPQKQVIRKEVVKAKATSNGSRPRPQLPAKSLSQRNESSPAGNDKARTGASSKSSSSAPIKAVRRASPSRSEPVARKRRLITTQRVVSSDESESDTSDSSVHKRVKTKSDYVDSRRRVRCESAFSRDGGMTLPELVHAADITSNSQPGKFKPAFGRDEASELTLQYPSNMGPERYQMVHPKESDDFNPLQDILQIAEIVPRYYLTEDQAQPFLDEITGIHRKIKRGVAHDSEEEVRESLAEYNEALGGLRDKGLISSNIDTMASPLPLPLVERILTQNYSRTVSLKVDSLRKYENGTDNVYGELLPRFISTIFAETGLKSDHVFVDLGSGVANVVLQAALEVGCESWGCEMMGNACDLAEMQEREFKARSRLWGIAVGDTHLERGDFLRNEAIHKALARADVVLVNNQAFTPALNQGLMNLFLDLREGCKIVSLKSFVPNDHKITTRNINSPINLLEAETKNYYSNCVSWTNAPGTYCIAIKDSTKLREFSKRHGG